MRLNFTSYYQFRMFFVLCTVLIPSVCFSQISSFIQTVPASDISENPEMDIYQARLRKNPNLAGYQFVKLNPLAHSQKDGFLTLNIPNREKPIIAEASQVKYYSETDYEWIGKTDEDRGTVIIISKEGRVCAHISTPDGVYEIFPAPRNLYCLQIIDVEKAGDVGCASTGDGRNGGRIKANEIEVQSENNFQAPTNAKMNPCQPLVNPRVLVLYTPKALALAGNVAGIQTIADMSVSQFNSCIYNSDITSNAVLTLAGIAPLNNLPETQSITNDLNSLENNVAAQNLRNQHKADLVVLFTDAQYQNGDTRGKAQTVSLENSKSLAIVELWHATSRKTFAHEVGHLYGCRHEDTPGSPTYAQGYCIKNGLAIVADRTVMVGKNISDDQSKNRLLNFSNPSINVGGKASETNNENNAKRVIESHSIVSSFRPNPNPIFVAYLDGPTFVTNQGSKNYELTYSCGSAPYSIVWHYSYDGINYLSSNTTTDVFTWFFYQNQKVWIRATVTGNGKSVSAFIAVTAQMPSPYKIGISKDSPSPAATNFLVSPNPSASEVVISYQLHTNSQVELEILDQSGQVIIQLINRNTSQKEGSHSTEWDLTQYPSGTYLARLTINGLPEIRRIVITK